MKIKFLVLLAMLAPGAAMAQTVYKCKAADGSTVYAQQPCGKDAEAREVKGQGVPSDVGDTSAREAMARNTATRNSAMTEDSCVASATQRAWRPANANIRTHEQRIAALNADIRRANNNLAGATWQAGLRQEIAGLQQAIATERATAQSLESTGRQQCADARKQRDEQIAERAERDKD